MLPKKEDNKLSGKKTQQIDTVKRKKEFKKLKDGGKGNEGKNEEFKEEFKAIEEENPNKKEKKKEKKKA